MPASLYPPDLLPGAGELLSAFWECSSDRSIAIGMNGVVTGEVPFTSIDRYAARYGFDDPEDFDFLRRMVRAMDDEFLAAKSRRENPKTVTRKAE